MIKIESFSPIDNLPRGYAYPQHSHEYIGEIIANAVSVFPNWRDTPAPERGRFIYELGKEFRNRKESLADIITSEVGKTKQEALGEVQEVIDICDYAVGLSRQLWGLTIASERPNHSLNELWHPLGPVAVITAFNFPMAVWAWNAAIGLVCGNPIIWKPSEKALSCATVCNQVAVNVAERMELPKNLCQIVYGHSAAGESLASSFLIPLVSATGSVEMGKSVARTVAGRLGRYLLELGGNNGLIVTPSANLELAARAILFSAIGTSGQRCTTLRRLFVHNDIAENLLNRLVELYGRVKIGDPHEDDVMMGPLIDSQACTKMFETIGRAQIYGGQIICGGEYVQGQKSLNYVKPTIIMMKSHDVDIVHNETFAPLLYVFKYNDLNEAIRMHNSVPQGLSSAIFTDKISEAGIFCSARGSDCGIVNVNIGTSGAEIGGAFGGEKDTGGGRESGSDAWKQYMRRVTNTVNYSTELPLAQGIKFEF